MTLVEALIKTRQEMPVLTANKTATITGRNGSSFTFKYPTLHNILNTVLPALHANGVWLYQDVSSADDTTVTVVTHAEGHDEHRQSSALLVKHDGSSRDMASKVAHARRIQLLAFLSLEAEEADERPMRQQPPPRQQPVAAKAATQETSWNEQAPLRVAAQKGLNFDHKKGSAGLSALITKLRRDDGDEDLMPITVVEGKSVSMYQYVTNLVDSSGEGERILSFLLGRVVTKLTPLRLTHKWLIDELRNGALDDTIHEVHNLIK